MRTLGHHMICISVARQLLEVLTDALRQGTLTHARALPTAGLLGEICTEVEALLARMVDAILGPFVHPEFGLLNETLAHDYSRPADGNEDLCYLGHAIETLWMVMAEAERQGDEPLYARAASLFRAHVDAARDEVAGGFYRGVFMREKRFLEDADCKVKCALLGGSNPSFCGDRLHAVPSPHAVADHKALPSFGSRFGRGARRGLRWLRNAACSPTKGVTGGRRRRC